MWWRLIGSALEHAAELAGKELDFQTLFLSQEEDDEESSSLGEFLTVLEARNWPTATAQHRAPGFDANDIAQALNGRGLYDTTATHEGNQIMREFLFPKAVPGTTFTSKAVGKRLKPHLHEPVRHGERTLCLKATWDGHKETMRYFVKVT